MNYQQFTFGKSVRTNVEITTEDIGIDIKIGSECSVFSEPSDNEELVGVSLPIPEYPHYCIIYLHQADLDIID